MEGDLGEIEAKLRFISYERLKGYWYPFRKLKVPGQPSYGRLDEIRPGTTFAMVWGTYIFDRELRLLVLDAIERIEIAVRALLAETHSRHFSSGFAYAVEPNALPEFDRTGYSREQFLEKHLASRVLQRNREEFIQHFLRQYGSSHPYPPIWIAVEVLSFGNVVRLLRASPRQVVDEIATTLGLPRVVLESWLQTLNEVRNIAAHHGRLWNRRLGKRPRTLDRKKYPKWFEPVEIFPTGNRGGVFPTLTICHFLLSTIAPGTTWARRFQDLLARHPDIPRRSLGMPEDWLKSPLWADAR